MENRTSLIKNEHGLGKNLTRCRRSEADNSVSGRIYSETLK
jgi:hypothetical protein